MSGVKYVFEILLTKRRDVEFLIGLLKFRLLSIYTAVTAKVLTNFNDIWQNSLRKSLMTRTWWLETRSRWWRWDSRRDACWWCVNSWGVVTPPRSGPRRWRTERGWKLYNRVRPAWSTPDTARARISTFLSTEYSSYTWEVQVFSRKWTYTILKFALILSNKEPKVVGQFCLILDPSTFVYHIPKQKGWETILLPFQMISLFEKIWSQRMFGI